MNTDSRFTRIPNILYDWLLYETPNLSKREIIVLMAIIRNTFGWNTTKAPMSCRYIDKQTRMGIGHISETIHLLESKGMILVDRSSRTAIISINPAAVVPVPKLGTSSCATVPESGTMELPNQELDSSQIGNESVTDSGTIVLPIREQINTERQIKENNKDTSADWLSD